jgi:cytidylate kinase
MYRASALLAIHNSIDLDDPSSVAEVIRRHSIDNRDGNIFIDDEDVSAFIRTPEISDAASIISAGTPVRREMVVLQRRFARSHDTVAEGRDMGTVVFPRADLKVYVIADVAIRVVRRWREFNAAGENADFDVLLKSQLIRDRRDRTRADSPLRLAPGAVILDSTLMNIEQQVSTVLDLYRNRLVKS